MRYVLASLWNVLNCLSTECLGEVSVVEGRLRSKTFLVWILTDLLTRCVTSGKLLNLSMPLFSHLLHWDQDSTYICCRILKQTRDSWKSGVKYSWRGRQVKILNLVLIDCLLCDRLCPGSWRIISVELLLFNEMLINQISGWVKSNYALFKAYGIHCLRLGFFFKKELCHLNSSLIVN